MQTVYCPVCRDERVVEQPECADGHDDCPERICVECASAIFVGWAADDKAAPPKRRGGRSTAA